MPAVLKLLGAVLLVVPVMPQSDQREDDLVLQRLEVERAELRLRHAEAEFEWQRRRLHWVTGLPVGEQVGQLAVGRDRGHDRYGGVRSEVERLQQALAGAEAEMRLRELDLEEMLLTGELPRTGLWTGLVDGRDIVSERLQARLESLTRIAVSLKSRHDAVRVMVDQRAIPWRDLASLANELDDVEAQIEEIELQLEMRRLFLADDLPADAQFVLEERALARQQKVIENGLSRARVQVDELEPLTGRGFASRLDLDEAQTVVRRLEQRLELLSMERRFFEHRLARWRQSRERGTRGGGD